MRSNCTKDALASFMPLHSNYHRRVFVGYIEKQVRCLRRPKTLTISCMVEVLRLILAEVVLHSARSRGLGWVAA